MKKKSLYDIAMEKKNIKNKRKQTKSDRELIILIEVMDKILKAMIYTIISILVSIGMTVLLNEEFRNIFIEIIQIN